MLVIDVAILEKHLKLGLHKVVSSLSQSRLLTSSYANAITSSVTIDNHSS